ncbi:hypothetical protein [Pseudoalteromonas sp. T1lg75]|uniref:hypothetical protein n=1 Tax=Pseudoalteromonas sp. T1lg75 TaxID=2077102 RepID=UPI000CF6A784|nr:hypothetical protein [Pseudoalteromonas sp. T1lg75]
MEVSAKLKNVEPIFLLITKFAVIVSTAFFIIGISYCVGLDAGYGVTTATPSIEEYTLIGFFVTFKVLGQVFAAIFSGLVSNWVVWPAMLGVVISFVLLSHLAFRLIPFLKKYEEGFEKKLNQWSLTTNSLATITLAASFLYLIPISAFTAGKVHADEVIEKIASNGCSRSFQGTTGWSICSEINLKGSTVIKGFLVYRTDDQAAFITHDTQDLIITPIPKDAVIKRLRIK